MPTYSPLRHEPEEWSTEAFIAHFLRIHQQMPERCFGFILGAGASFSSGISTGGQLVDNWLDELHSRDADGTGQAIGDWASAATLGIDEFDYVRRGEFYTQIYDRRFRDDFEEGYAYLESAMEHAEPSLGYSMLVQILAETRHKLVVTTNFDNLVADSVLLFTDKFAQICGHESLTGFIRVQPRRPLVAKIHRDLLLAPQNDPYVTNLLHEDWARVLRRLFARYTPLVVGYGGNDGSLMNFLYSLQENSIPGGIFWFYIHDGPKPNARIRRLVARQSGKLVPILNFDVLMCQLADSLKFGLLDARIESHASSNAQRLRDAWARVKAQVNATADSGKSAQEAIERVQQRREHEDADWWSWELKARSEQNLERRDSIYREALEKLPTNIRLLTSYSYFLAAQTDRFEEAEELGRRAIASDPSNPYCYNHLATTLAYVRLKFDDAEIIFLEALDLAPNSSIIHSDYAIFRAYVRRDYAAAKRMALRAIELDSKSPHALTTMAELTWSIDRDVDTSEGYLRMALAIDPQQLEAIAALASLTWKGKKDLKAAELLYSKISTPNYNLTDEQEEPLGYLELLIARRRFAEANIRSDVEWGRNRRLRRARTLYVVFLRGLLLRLQSRDDLDARGRLVTLFDGIQIRPIAPPNDVLAAVKELLAPDDYEFYSLLSSALVDERYLAGLNDSNQWREVKPIPLDVPWPQLARGDADQ